MMFLLFRCCCYTSLLALCVLSGAARTPCRVPLTDRIVSLYSLLITMFRFTAGDISTDQR